VPQTLTLVTPTYAGDLERFSLLRRSAQRWDVDLPHLAIVNDEDCDLFRRTFAGDPHLEVVPITALVPVVGRIRTGAMALHLRRPLARVGLRVTEGWFLQQIAKLEAHRIAGDGYIAMDSDSFFVRPFDPATFWDDDGKFMLFETTTEALEMQEWYCRSLRFLDVPVYGERARSHVDAAVPMHSGTVERMLQYIESVHRGPWWWSMLRHEVMEFSTYGGFARHVDKLHDVFVDNTEFVRLLWQASDGVNALAADLRDRTADAYVTVSGVASTNHLEPASYIDVVEALWDEIERESTTTA
jgi:hypothetical protein